MSRTKIRHNVVLSAWKTAAKPFFFVEVQPFPSSTQGKSWPRSLWMKSPRLISFAKHVGQRTLLQHLFSATGQIPNTFEIGLMASHLLQFGGCILVWHYNGQIQRASAIFVPKVLFCPKLHQQLGRIGETSPGCNMQRGVSTDIILSIQPSKNIMAVGI